MADFDKDSIMNIIGSLVGDDKKGDVSSILDSLTGGKKEESNSNSNYDSEFNNNKSNDSGSTDLFDTNKMMEYAATFMSKVKNSQKTREHTLLTAIRPYLQDGRKGKLDSCMKVLQVASIIKELNVPSNKPKE